MISIIKGLFKRKTVKNGVWLYLLQFFNLVVPLVTLPYITRILGASQYGFFSIALNIVGYLQVVVEYGFGLSATRDVAINGKENLSKKFTSVICSRVILTVISILIGLLYILINKANYQLWLSFLVLMICLLGYCVQMNWVFQGLQEMKFISIVNIIARSVSTVLVFILVKSENDLFLYCFLYSISPFLSGWIGCFLAKKRYSLRFIKVSTNDVACELKNGFYVFTVNLSSRVFGAVGISFLGVFATSYEVGVFSAIQKIPNLLILIWAPINQIIYPISSQRFFESVDGGIQFIKKIKSYALPLIIVVIVILSFFNKSIVNLLYGKDYIEYSYWLIPLLGWGLISIDNNFLGVQTLMGSGHDKEYGKAFQKGVIATVAINFVLISTLKGMGAAIAPLLSEGTFNIILRNEVRRVMIDGCIKHEK